MAVWRETSSVCLELGFVNFFKLDGLMIQGPPALDKGLDYKFEGVIENGELCDMSSQILDVLLLVEETIV